MNLKQAKAIKYVVAVSETHYLKSTAKGEIVLTTNQHRAIKLSWDSAADRSLGLKVALGIDPVLVRYTSWGKRVRSAARKARKQQKGE